MDHPTELQSHRIVRWMSVAAASAAAFFAAPAAAGDSNALDEVIVTAQKQSELLDKVPVAITVIKGGTLDKSNITDLTGLNGFVPGLAVEKSSGSELMISIRGIGSETPQNLYTQPGVSVFVDGIYIPTALGVYQGFYDVDQIEVLRGPQGTLFGQSSTGGTINIVTKQPVLGVLSGDTELSYGNYNLNRERADVNLPLADTLAVRIAFQHYQHDGFGENVAIPNYQLDVANDTIGRISALWQPIENLSSTTTARMFQEDHNGAEQKNLADPNPDARQVEQDTPAHLDMHYLTFSEALAWQSPWFTIKSLSGYQKMHNDQAIDDDRLTSQILGYYNSQPVWDSHLNAFTQELNLLSTPGGVIDYTAGMYYIWQKTSQYIVELENAGAIPTAVTIPGVLGPSPANVSYEEHSIIKRNSWAPFVQATYHILDRLRATAGVRYNHDAYDGEASFYYSPLDRVPSYSSHVVTGKAEVDFDLTSTDVLYASWNKGYKPGGINNTYNAAEAVLVKQFFDPETARSVELGTKSRFLDGALSINAAGFYSRYKNMQYLASDPFPFQAGTANIPTTEIWGGELEASFLALDSHLRLNANLTGLGGRFTDNYYTIDAQSASAARKAYEAANPGAGDFDPATIAAVAAAESNTKGNVPPKLPKWAGSLNAAYVFNFLDQTFTPRAEFVYRGGFDYRVFNNGALDNVPSYDLFNVYLEYVPPIHGLKLSFAATNLANKDGIGGRFTDPYGSGQTSNEFIAPRQFVVSAGYSF